MPLIAPIEVIPESIHFFGGIAITPDKDLSLDDMANNIKDIIDRLHVEPKTPCEVVYELPANTTGNPVSGFLKCLPWVMPTLCVTSSQIIAIKLKNGDTVAPDLFDGFKLIESAIKKHQIDYNINQQTGNYKLSIVSDEVESVVVSFGFGDINVRIQK